MCQQLPARVSSYSVTAVPSPTKTIWYFEADEREKTIFLRSDHLRNRAIAESDNEFHLRVRPIPESKPFYLHIAGKDVPACEISYLDTGDGVSQVWMFWFDKTMMGHLSNIPGKESSVKIKETAEGAATPTNKNVTLRAKDFFNKRKKKPFVE